MPPNYGGLVEAFGRFYGEPGQEKKAIYLLRVIISSAQSHRAD
jgi:hypothetical protein